MQDLFTNRLARDKKNEGKEEKHRVFRRCNFATQLHSQSMQLRYRRLQKKLALVVVEDGSGTIFFPAMY